MAFSYLEPDETMLPDTEDDDDLPQAKLPPAQMRRLPGLDVPARAPGDSFEVQAAKDANANYARVYGERPEAPKPKWWQRALAGAAGSLAGVSNAAGRTREPINIAQMTEAIEAPGYRRKLDDWARRTEAAGVARDVANANRDAWWKNQQFQDQRDLHDAQAEQAREHAAYYRNKSEAEQTQWKVNGRGQLYNTITGEVKNPELTPQDRFKQAKDLGFDDDSARIYAVNGKAPEPKTATPKNPTNPQEVLLNPDQFTPDQVKKAEDMFGKMHRPPASNSDDSQAMYERIAKSLAGGDLTRLKDIASLRGDQRLRIFDRAKQINPNFNTSELDRQIKMEDYYANGKGADQLQSFGTFLEHAGTAVDVMNQLKQTNASVLNKSINWLRGHTSSPEYRKALAAVEPVKKEFESFLLNNRALYSEDRAAADKMLNEDLPLSDFMAAIGQMGHTVQARYNESDRRYRNVRRKGLQESFPLTDEAIAGAKKIGVNLGGRPTAGRGANTQQAGGGKITVTAPDGSVHPFDTQAQADAFKKLAGIK